MTTKMWAAFGLGLAMALAGGSTTALAQVQTKPAAKPAEAAKPATAPASAAPAAPASAAPAVPASSSGEAGWAVSCAAQGRRAPVNCAAEQRIVARETGQLISGVSVRVPGDTRQPVMVIQVPFGLYLPAGLKLQVDQGATTDLVIESCEPAGCYAVAPAAAALVNAMTNGQVLEIRGTTRGREPFTVTHLLGGFKTTFDGIR